MTGQQLRLPHLSLAWVRPTDATFISQDQYSCSLSGVISTDVYIDGGNGAEWYINQVYFHHLEGKTQEM